MSPTIQESAAKILIGSGAVRNVTIFPVTDPRGNRWAVSFKIGVEEYTVGSFRQKVRLWAKIETIVEWLKDLGISDASLKLV
jgi:hypothetical protein